MKITDHLLEDHRSFRATLAEMEIISNLPPLRRDLARLGILLGSLKAALDRHAALEDEVYYPAVSARLRDRPHPLLTEAYMHHLDHEHDTIERYLRQLEQQVAARPPQPTWPQTYALFSRGLETHMRREEQELFPISEGLLGDDELRRLEARTGR